MDYNKKPYHLHHVVVDFFDSHLRCKGKFVHILGECHHMAVLFRALSCHRHGSRSLQWRHLGGTVYSTMRHRSAGIDCQYETFASRLNTLTTHTTL